jgi:antitoxin component YwqK of YwqJK toxin-antitoxin module
MKNFLLLITILIAGNGYSQKSQAYYDYLWKPCAPEQARYFSEIQKTDSGWLRYDYFLGTKTLQMSGLFEDSATKIANGYFRYFYANGIPETFGQNVHNKKEGLWMRYDHEGHMEDSTVYIDGNPSGTSLGWHSNGYMADSISYSADGSAVEVNWRSNGIPSSAGRLMNGELNGVWVFFHANGKLASRVLFNMGYIQKEEYFDTTGAPEKTATEDRPPTFPGGQNGWKKFVLKHIYFPSQYKLVNADQVTVVITATIDEDGNVIDPFIEVPFNKAFDDIALKIFKKSPKWLPAIRSNRTVLQKIRQPITFSQSE